MKLDRTKHNKFVTGAVYGNTTSGDITPSSSTASAVGGGGTTVIIQGGGGSQEPVELGLGDLTNVGTWANEVAAEDRFMVQVANGNQWVAKPISDIVNGDSDLTNYAKISYVDEKLADKVDNAFFLRVFGVIGENDEEIPVNDISSTIKSIQVKFGLWTNEFLSAIGLNPTDGEITAISLSSLNDVSLNQQLIEGQALVWNGNFWTNQSIESGLDEDSLQNYLHTNKYVTQDYVAEQLQSYATVGELNQFKIETSESLDNLQSEINDLSDKKLDKAFFKALFGLMDDDVEIEPNAKEIPESASIKAKFGLWTEEYLSALGMNPANGDVALTLASLNDVQFSELTEGQSIVWNGTKWINQLIESGGLDESQLEDYLSRNNYATTQDITDAISSKVDTSTFNSTISGLNTSISDLETELETKAGKDELSTAVSTINTRIDGVVTDINTELATKATKTELAEAVTTLEQSISDVDDDLQAFKTTTEENLATKLDIAFFSKVFGLIGEDGSEITVNNDTSVTIESIQAKFGLWTEQFLSAKGLNPSDGSVTGISLKDLAGVNISSPQNGEGLIYQDGYWINQVVQTGEEGNPFYVWQGESEAAPTLKNAPANQWTTTTLKNEHIDDYYVTTKGLVYQFTNINGTYSWELVTDKYLIDCWNKLDQFDDDLTERIETIEESITGVSSAVSAEVERAKEAEQKIADDLLALVNKLNQMFTLEGDGSTDNPYRIKANYGLYTDQFLSALGTNT